MGNRTSTSSVLVGVAGMYRFIEIFRKILLLFQERCF